MAETEEKINVVVMGHPDFWEQIWNVPFESEEGYALQVGDKSQKENSLTSMYL